MPSDTLIAALIDAVGRQHVLSDAPAMSPYLTDWRGRYHGHAEAVVLPGSVDEVARVVSACAAAGVAIVPQGGNTGLCGGATPLDGSAHSSVVVALGRLDRIRSVDAEAALLVAEAGCTLVSAQRAACAEGMLFPLSLGAEGTCQLGGNLATNAGGVHVMRYGTMRELTLGVEVVLADGRVLSDLRGLRKDNTGYKLSQLFIGSEGTLGIITAAALRLYPAPRQRAMAWLGVGDLAQASMLLARLRGADGGRLNAFEVINAAALSLVLKHFPESRQPLRAVSPWQVLVEWTDADEGGDLDDRVLRVLEQVLEDGLVSDAVVAQGGAQHAQLWSLRERIAEAQRLEGFSIKHDIALPQGKLAQFVLDVDAELLARFPGIRIVAFGHMGDGNLHYNLSMPRATGDDDGLAFLAHCAEINRRVHDAVDRLGGSFSAEHGIGQLKREELSRYRSAVELDLMRAIKRTFDPLGLMNLGKVLPD